jgi:hypothetical protein
VWKEGRVTDPHRHNKYPNKLLNLKDMVFLFPK